MKVKCRTMLVMLSNPFYRITPDICSYATMLSAYVNASDMVGAEKFFRRLKEDGLRPNVVVYGTLMKGYAKENNPEKVMRVYERMRVQGVEPNQTIFTTIMDAHGKNSDFGSSVIWFNEMSARGFPPDQKAKNILLSLAKTPEEREEANKLVGNIASNLSGQKASDITDFNGHDKNGEATAGSESSETRNGADLTEETVGMFSNLDVGDDCESDDGDVVVVDDGEDEDDELDFVSLEESEELLPVNQ